MFSFCDILCFIRLAVAPHSVQNALAMAYAFVLADVRKAQTKFIRHGRTWFFCIFHSTAEALMLQIEPIGWDGDWPINNVIFLVLDISANNFSVPTKGLNLKLCT